MTRCGINYYLIDLPICGVSQHICVRARFCLNKDCSNLWVMDVIPFLALRLRRMSFGMDFLLPKLRTYALS
jgi:hypothetical protein